MRILAVAAVAALALSACQDPSGVGLGLIDEEQADPSVRVIPLSGLDTLQVRTTAIGVADASNDQVQARVLAGAVVDPEFGDVTAVAYMDFLQPTIADDVTGADVSEAWIDLGRRYAYGDTTTTLPLDLRPIQGQWDVDTSYPGDTLFAVGEVLSTTEVTIADTLRRFDIPESWVRSNADLLVGDSFGDGFEGFALQVPEGYMPAPGIVYGFDTLLSQSSALRVVVSEDTLTFPLSEVFSSIDASEPALAPTTYVPARANTNAGLQFLADLSGVGVTPLANARILLPLDVSLLQAGTFVRPVSTRSLLFGVRVADDGTKQRVTLGELGATVADEVILINPLVFTARIQAILLDPETEGFDYYELLPSSTPVSINVLPVLRPAEGNLSPPRFTLTLVGAPS